MTSRLFNLILVTCNLRNSSGRQPVISEKFKFINPTGGLTMGLFDNGFRIGTGVAVGIGALILAPTVIPMVAAIVKPLAKAAIKSGLMLVEKGKEIAAETKEVLEDLAAEAKAELTAEQAHAAASQPEMSASPVSNPEQGSV